MSPREDCTEKEEYVKDMQNILSIESRKSSQRERKSTSTQYRKVVLAFNKKEAHRPYGGLTLFQKQRKTKYKRKDIEIKIPQHQQQAGFGPRRTAEKTSQQPS